MRLPLGRTVWNSATQVTGSPHLLPKTFFMGGIDTVIVDLYNHWPNPDAELAIFCSGPHQGVAALAQIFTPDRMAAR